MRSSRLSAGAAQGLVVASREAFPRRHRRRSSAAPSARSARCGRSSWPASPATRHPDGGDGRRRSKRPGACSPARARRSAACARRRGARGRASPPIRRWRSHCAPRCSPHRRSTCRIRELAPRASTSSRCSRGSASTTMVAAAPLAVPERRDGDARAGRRTATGRRRLHADHRDQVHAGWSRWSGRCRPSSSSRRSTRWRCGRRRASPSSRAASSSLLTGAAARTLRANAGFE